MTDYLRRERVIDAGINAFEGVLRKEPLRWPLLTRAAQDVVMLYSPKYEWLIDKAKQCDLGHMHNVRSTEFNYTQIFRSPVSYTQIARARYGNPKRQALEYMLDMIEAALRSGQRHLNVGAHACPYSTLGSVPSFLGRWPREGDTVRLGILRDLTLREHPDRDSQEWIIELTVMAVPGRDV